MRYFCPNGCEAYGWYCGRQDVLRCHLVEGSEMACASQKTLILMVTIQRVMWLLCGNHSKAHFISYTLSRLTKYPVVLVGHSVLHWIGPACINLIHLLAGPYFLLFNHSDKKSHLFQMRVLFKYEFWKILIKRYCWLVLSVLENLHNSPNMCWHELKLQLWFTWYMLDGVNER